jgi:hypothetical protein
MTRRNSKSLYDVHPGVAMVRKWADELPVKTGRSLDQWCDIVRSIGPADTSRKMVVNMLKSQYGLGTIAAGQIFEATFGQATWDGDPDLYLANAIRYVDNQYFEAKATLRPILDAIVAYVRKALPETKICPCKTMVPLYRSRVYAEVRPATASRFELCLALDDIPFGGVLDENPRAKGSDRLRHRISMTSADDFDSIVKKWLARAYEIAIGKSRVED